MTRRLSLQLRITTRTAACPISQQEEETLSPAVRQTIRLLKHLADQTSKTKAVRTENTNRSKKEML